MGRGGRMYVREEEEAERLRSPPTRGASTSERVPVDKPPFSVGDLKKAIPPHCFQRSLLRSFSYLLVDLTFVSLFLYLALHFLPLLPSPLHLAAWPLYWAAQGCVMTGVWVLAHECGHHAFSDYVHLDDLVGFLLHSSLLVPYFSWKYSHRRHHSNTGSVERDEVFVPKQRSQKPRHSAYLNNPPGRLLIIAVQLTLGWPLYLAFNVSGRPYSRFACHFDPYGPIYNDRERAQIFASDVGFLAACFALYRLSSAFSFLWVLRIYGVPLLITNGFLVLITYLQHTHPALPHYESSEWDWLRGALATVDRDFGFLNTVFHHIADTHVAHHLFSTMPHYHAMEATRAIKSLLGGYYKFDGTSIPVALYREVKECLYVEPDPDASNKGVLWYRNNYH